MGIHLFLNIHWLWIYWDRQMWHKEANNTKFWVFTRQKETNEIIMAEESI